MAILREGHGKNMSVTHFLSPPGDVPFATASGSDSSFSYPLK